MSPKLLALVVALIALAGAGLAIGATMTTGTASACATVTVQANGTKLGTFTKCTTVTYTIPTTTVFQTVTVTTGATTTTAPTTTTTTTPPPAGTLGPDAPGLGSQADTSCANGVISAPETWATNTPYNVIDPNPSSIPWSNVGVPPSFTKWYVLRGQIDGQYAGTTDQILQWAACKWGIDPDLARAAAVQESDWHQDQVGDVCGPVGEGSYGILQVKNMNCQGVGDWGGYPDTAKYTAVSADAWGAAIRGCINGDFDQGWLYSGQTVQQIVAANGLDYLVWGCVGFWFSGDWYDSGAKSYIASVQQHLANQDWLKEG